MQIEVGHGFENTMICENKGSYNLRRNLRFSDFDSVSRETVFPSELLLMRSDPRSDEGDELLPSCS